MQGHTFRICTKVRLPTSKHLGHETLFIIASKMSMFIRQYPDKSFSPAGKLICSFNNIIYYYICLGLLSLSTTGSKITFVQVVSVVEETLISSPSMMTSCSSTLTLSGCSYLCLYKNSSTTNRFIPVVRV